MAKMYPQDELTRQQAEIRALQARVGQLEAEIAQLKTSRPLLASKKKRLILAAVFIFQFVVYWGMGLLIILVFLRVWWASIPLTALIILLIILTLKRFELIK